MQKLTSFFLFFILFASIIAIKQVNAGVYNNMVSELDDYGNWCGGGNGGMQNCCNGGPCSACVADIGTAVRPSAACLEQCPPIDEVDLACAQHDLCCFNNEKQINCIPQGNYCPCDCALTNDVEAAEGTCPNLYCSAYCASLQVTFHTLLSCFWDDGAQQDCGSNRNNLCDHGTYP